TVVLKSPATIIGEEGIGGNECQKERLREKFAGAYMFLKVKDKEDEEIEMSIMR
ncbi:9735_t:CDS:1, partial [Paraglomus occultum]